VRTIAIAFLMALFVSACAGTSEPEPAPPPPTVRQAPPPPPPPAPPPKPAPAPVYEAPELPKTASSRPALALGGLAALAGAGALHWLRRRL